MTTTTHVRRRPGIASRRLGYTVTAGVNTLLLYLLNSGPGWRALPFLTDDTSRVLLLVNLSLAAGVLVNAGRLLYDARWLVSLGDIVSTAIGTATLVRIWQVFPFHFTAQAADWALVARTVLGFAIAGSLIGILVHVVTLLRAVADAATGDGGTADLPASARVRPSERNWPELPSQLRMKVARNMRCHPNGAAPTLNQPFSSCVAVRFRRTRRARWQWRGLGSCAGPRTQTITPRCALRSTEARTVCVSGW